MSEQDQADIEIIIIDEKDSPFSQEDRSLKAQSKKLAGKALQKTAAGAWWAGKKVWQSEARKKTTKVLGQQASKAWKSETRKKATRKAGEQIGKVVEKNKDTIQQAVTQAVNERLDKEKERITQTAKETDWKEVAQKGTSTGLKKISEALSRWAQQLNDEPNKTSQK